MKLLEDALGSPSGEFRKRWQFRKRPQAELLEKLERRHVLMRIANRGQLSRDFDQLSGIQCGENS